MGRSTFRIAQFISAGAASILLAPASFADPGLPHVVPQVVGSSVSLPGIKTSFAGPDGPGAINCESPEDGPHLGYYYQQDSYNRVDPAGDLCLVQRSYGSRRKLAWLLLRQRGAYNAFQARKERLRQQHAIEDTHPLFSANVHVQKTCGEDEAQGMTEEMIRQSVLPVEVAEKLLIDLKNSELEIEGRENPINVDGFSKLFTQIIQEERARGIEPSLGEPHQWSSEFLRKHGGKFKMETQFSKLYVALAMGVTSRYLVAGKEGELNEWLVAQPDESVTIEKIFRKSYQLNKGDVYLTLLTIENVLSRFWTDPKRDSRIVTTKLQSIINYLGDKEDRFGTWYHLFGMMLYGYVQGSAKARFVGNVESVGSMILSGQAEAQEGFVNDRGGIIGNNLRKIVTRREYERHKADPKHLEVGSYLNLNEDFRDRIEVYSNPNFTLQFLRNGEALRLTSDAEGLKQCKVEIIPDHGDGFNSRAVMTFKARDFAKGEPQTYFMQGNPKAVRVFMTGCRK